MSYLKTLWVDNVTPISAVNLDKIEQYLVDSSTDFDNRGLSASSKVVTGDWNSYINTGFFIGNNLTNAPITGFCYVQVIRYTALYVCQIATDFSNTGTFVRLNQNGVWAPWRRMSRDTDKGIANGIASLDAAIKVPAAQLGNVISAINTSSIVWELLATKTSATDFTSADFTSIPAYNTYRIIAHVKSSDASVKDLSIRFNGIMTTHSAWTNNNGVITSVLNSSDIVFTGAVKDYGAPYGTNIVDILISNHNPLYHTIMGATSYEGKFLQLDGTWDYNATINRMTISSLFDSDSIIKLFGSKSLV